MSARLFCRLVAYGPYVTSPVEATFSQTTEPFAVRPLAVIKPALTAPEQSIEVVAMPELAVI